MQKPECPVYLLFEEPEKYVAKDGAESFEELYHRTGEFIEQVLRPQLEAGKNVLVGTRCNELQHSQSVSRHTYKGFLEGYAGKLRAA